MGALYFIQSNDNMELMTKVQSEQHSSRELLCRLSQQDEEIKQLKEMVRLLQLYDCFILVCGKRLNDLTTTLCPCCSFVVENQFTLCRYLTEKTR